MTPKEKAEELILNFMNLQEPNYNWFDKRLGKQCALISVDEIIRLDIFNCNCEWSDEDGDTREYWQEVKQEIEKL